MKIGYARVSTTDQSLDIQRAALMAAGVVEDHLFEERVSGKTANDRPELQRCLQFARSGDTVLVTKLDRLARSARDLHNILAELDAKGVGFRCLDQSAVDTASSTGRLTLAILGAVSEFELAIRSERQREGIAAAQAKGTYQKRQSQIDFVELRKLTARGLKPGEIAPIMKISRASVYRALAQIKATPEEA